MQCAAAGLPILHFLKARLDELPFGLPRGEGHHPPPKKCAYMEVNDAGDEQDMLAGKGKAADVGGVGRAGPSTTTKCLQLSGRSEVTEGGSPCQSTRPCHNFAGLSNDASYLKLVQILFSLTIKVSLLILRPAVLEFLLTLM
jgi:hypothetical protein